MGSAVAAKDNEEEGLETVPELGKLDYSIEMDYGKTTLGNLFDSPMAPTKGGGIPASIKGHKTQTKKQLLSQSKGILAEFRIKNTNTKYTDTVSRLELKLARGLKDGASKLNIDAKRTLDDGIRTIEQMRQIGHLTDAAMFEKVQDYNDVFVNSRASLLAMDRAKYYAEHPDEMPNEDELIQEFHNMMDVPLNSGNFDSARIKFHTAFVDEVRRRNSMEKLDDVTKELQYGEEHTNLMANATELMALGQYTAEDYEDLLDRFVKAGDDTRANALRLDYIKYTTKAPVNPRLESAYQEGGIAYKHLMQGGAYKNNVWNIEAIKDYMGSDGEYRVGRDLEKQKIVRSFIEENNKTRGVYASKSDIHSKIDRYIFSEIQKEWGDTGTKGVRAMMEKKFGMNVSEKLVQTMLINEVSFLQTMAKLNFDYGLMKDKVSADIQNQATKKENIYSAENMQKDDFIDKHGDNIISLVRKYTQMDAPKPSPNQFVPREGLSPAVAAMPIVQILEYQAKQLTKKRTNAFNEAPPTDQELVDLDTIDQQNKQNKTKEFDAKLKEMTTGNSTKVVPKEVSKTTVPLPSSNAAAKDVPVHLGENVTVPETNYSGDATIPIEMPKEQPEVQEPTDAGEWTGESSEFDEFGVKKQPTPVDWGNVYDDLTNLTHDENPREVINRAVGKTFTNLGIAIQQDITKATTFDQEVGTTYGDRSLSVTLPKGLEWLGNKAMELEQRAWDWGKETFEDTKIMLEENMGKAMLPLFLTGLDASDLNAHLTRDFPKPKVTPDKQPPPIDSPMGRFDFFAKNKDRIMQASKDLESVKIQVANELRDVGRKLSGIFDTPDTLPKPFGLDIPKILERSTPVEQPMVEPPKEPIIPQIVKEVEDVVSDFIMPQTQVSHPPTTDDAAKKIMDHATQVRPWESELFEKATIKDKLDVLPDDWDAAWDVVTRYLGEEAPLKDQLGYWKRISKQESQLKNNRLNKEKQSNLNKLTKFANKALPIAFNKEMQTLGMTPEDIIQRLTYVYMGETSLGTNVQDSSTGAIGRLQVLPTTFASTIAQGQFGDNSALMAGISEVHFSQLQDIAATVEELKRKDKNAEALAAAKPLIPFLRKEKVNYMAGMAKLFQLLKAKKL